jgi:hypothetical protein
MDGIKDKIKEARSAGYSDEEIVQFLTQTPTVGTQVSAAIESQYSPKEILSFLSDTKSKAYQEGEKMPTFSRAMTSAMGGPTLGFFDELAGAVSAPIRAIQQRIPLGEAYRQGRDIARGAAQSYEKESPFLAAGGQLVSSLPMMAGRGLVSPLLEAVKPSLTMAPSVARAAQYVAGTPQAGQVMGLGQRAVQAGASGAGYGLIGGVGGSTAESPEEIVSDALQSAAIGAGLGAVSQPAMAVLGAGGRQITGRVFPSSASTYAQQKVGEALIRDVPESLSQSALTRAQTRLARLGPEARIADVGGKSTRNLLDVQATLPGTTAEAVERAIRERQAGRAGRLVTAADEALGTQGAKFLEKIDDFNNQRFVQSRPYYAAIDKASVKINAPLADVLNKSQSVMGSTELLFRTKTGQTLDLAKLQPGEQVPMNVLDSLKQSLYDASSTLRRSGSNAQAEAYDEVRQKLIKELEAQSPKIGGQSAYTMALKTWAGPSQMKDAAEIGRTVMRGDILDVQQATKGLSPSEIDAFRIGAIQALRQQTGTESGQTALLKMWKEPATQERLKIAFGNDYRTFAAAVAKEARLKSLEATGRGSQTAARIAGAADLDVAPLTQAVAAASSGSPTGIIAAATNIARQTQTPEAVRNEIGRILLSRDPRQLEQLSEVIRRLNESRSRAAGGAGFAAGQAGGISQGYVAP